MSNSQDDDPLIWGLQNIADEIACSKRQAQYLVAKGAIPVERLGHRTIIVRRSVLRKMGCVAAATGNASNKRVRR